MIQELRRHSGWLALALAIGFTLGAGASAAVLVGPAGFRPAGYHPPAAVRPTPSSFPFQSPGATPSGSAPSAREFAAMAFDAAIGKMVLFGGVDGYTGKVQGDTWTWDGKTWKQLRRQDSDPLPRASATMVYDAAHKVVVMRGGIDSATQFRDETWTWDGTTWKKAAPAQSPPVPPIDAREPMVWDSARNRVLLYAFAKDPYLKYDVPQLNQLWTWDGANWAPLAASGAPTGHEFYDADMAYDSSRQQAVFFGHADEIITTATSTRIGRTALPTTWTFDGSAWRKVSTTGPKLTSVMFGAVIASDDARGGLVTLDPTLNTWTWDGSQWNLRAPDHVPAGSFRIGEAVAYDPVRRVVVLFGGRRQFGTIPDSNDTWTWNGTDWTEAA